jgi:hypothetical protein
MAKQVFNSDKWASSLAHILLSSDRQALEFRFWGFWDASCSFVPADILGLFSDTYTTDPILALEAAITLIKHPQYFVDKLAELKASKLPVVDEPAQPNQQVEVFEPLQPLNFDALQIALDQFVYWFLTCPYSRSTNEKKRVFDDAVSSISKEFNLTSPQSKNYFWGVRQRLGLLP